MTRPTNRMPPDWGIFPLMHSIQRWKRALGGSSPATLWMESMCGCSNGSERRRRLHPLFCFGAEGVVVFWLANVTLGSILIRPHAMTAELKELYFVDVECPLEEFQPEPFDCFELTLRAMFGPVGEEASESFQVQVCTPKWLQGRCDSGDVVHGRHTLIVGEFNVTQLRAHLEALGRRCSGDNWLEVAQKLSRYGLWEFEDYRPVL